MEAFNSLLSFLPQSRDAPVRAHAASAIGRSEAVWGLASFMECMQHILCKFLLQMHVCGLLLAALLMVYVCTRLCNAATFVGLRIATLQAWGLGVQVICCCTGTHCWDSFVCVRCAASPTASDAIGRPRPAACITLRDSGRSPCDRRA